MRMLLLLLAGCSTYSFKPIDVGARSDKALRAKSNQQFLRNAYADLVTRAPGDYTFTVTDGSGAQVSSFPVDEQQTLLDAMDGLGDPTALRALIVEGLVRSSESTLPEKSQVEARAFITQQFERLLGREPGAYELAAFVDAWKDANVGPRTVVRAIVGSREYQSY